MMFTKRSALITGCTSPSIIAPLLSTLPRTFLTYDVVLCCLHFMLLLLPHHQHKTISEKDSISLYCHFLVEDNLCFEVMESFMKVQDV